MKNLRWKIEKPLTLKQANTLILLARTIGAWDDGGSTSAINNAQLKQYFLPVYSYVGAWNGDFNFYSMRKDDIETVYSFEQAVRFFKNKIRKNEKELNNKAVQPIQETDI